MILWKNQIQVTDYKKKMACRIKPSDKVLSLDFEKEETMQVDVLERKRFLKTPYRLRTTNHCIDVYFRGYSFLVMKPDKSIVFRNIRDIRYDFNFGIYEDGKLWFEPYKSLLQDPAHMGMYLFKVGGPKTIIVHGFVLKTL